MKMEISEHLRSLLRRRLELIYEDDFVTAARKEIYWEDEYRDLCMSIARQLQVEFFIADRRGAK